MDHSLYTQAPFRQAAGAQLRPGGLTLTGELASLCGLHPGDRVLDVGCGVGSTASFLARAHGVSVVGLDSSASFLDEAADRDPEVTCIRGEAQRIPYPEEHFDAVFAECFLSGLDDREEVLGEIGRVLKPGGRLAVSDMYLRGTGTRLPAPDHPALCLRGLLSAEATRSLYESVGFTLLTWQDRSEALKAFLGSLIFSYGSAAAFWSAAGAGEGDLHEWVTDARPGYFLMVAENR